MSRIKKKGKKNNRIMLKSNSNRDRDQDLAVRRSQYRQKWKNCSDFLSQGQLRTKTTQQVLWRECIKDLQWRWSVGNIWIDGEGTTETWIKQTEYFASMNIAEVGNSTKIYWFVFKNIFKCKPRSCQRNQRLRHSPSWRFSFLQSITHSGGAWWSSCGTTTRTTSTPT